MTENTQPPEIEKTYYTYRTFSGKIFQSDVEIFCAEKISEHKKQMVAESPEVKQSS